MAIREGRFSGGRAQGIAEFTASIGFDKRLYHYDILGSKAHVTMLAECGIVPEKTAQTIKTGLDRIEEQINTGNFDFSAELEDIHMHLEHALIEAIGDEGARLHSGRSRNDQIALDIRLYLRDECDAITEGIRDFQRQLVSLAEQHADTIMPGFTHLQHAQPVLFAHHLLAYVEMFERDIERLADCRKRIDIMPLGAGAMAGSTLPLNRERVAEILGFSRIAQNSMDAVADRDFACEILSVLAIFSMHISRLAEDVILWCSQEFGFAEPDDQFSTGSSLMPQKKNPDLAELCRGKTARVYGDLVTLLSLCKNLPLTYNSDLQEDKEPLFDAIDTVKAVITVFPPMITSLNIKKQRMLSMASDPYLMATDLAEELVQRGIPFRKAHKHVGELIRWCAENKRSPADISIQEMQQHIPEADEKCRQIFSPQKSIAGREMTGATGPQQVKKQIGKWKQQLD